MSALSFPIKSLIEPQSSAFSGVVPWDRELDSRESPLPTAAVEAPAGVARAMASSQNLPKIRKLHENLRSRKSHVLSRFHDHECFERNPYFSAVSGVCRPGPCEEPGRV